MHVYDHIIIDNEIIGISPVYKKQFSSAAYPFNYPQQLFFQLHLKAHTIEISTNVFEGSPLDEKEKSNSEKITDEIFDARESVVEFLNKKIKANGSKKIPTARTDKK